MMDITTDFRLSYYRKIDDLDAPRNGMLVRHIESKHVYVLKALSQFDKRVYHQLDKISLEGLPSIKEIIESGETLYVIEEFISSLI